MLSIKIKLDILILLWKGHTFPPSLITHLTRTQTQTEFQVQKRQPLISPPPSNSFFSSVDIKKKIIQITVKHKTFLFTMILTLIHHSKKLATFISPCSSPTPFQNEDITRPHLLFLF